MADPGGGVEAVQRPADPGDGMERAADSNAGVKAMASAATIFFFSFLPYFFPTRRSAFFT